MIQLAKKKVDDAYETENMIVHVDQDKEPVLLEIFEATKLLKGLNRTLPSKLKGSIFSSAQI